MLWESILPNAISGEASHAAHAGDLIQLRMDSDAFAGFYERSARPLWAYLARVSGDPALADDLMQESYVRFLSAARTPRLEDGEVAGRRYLFRIATNLLRDHWRRPASTSIEEMPEEFFAARDDSERPDSEQGQAAAILTPAMARMNPRERQLLWLAHAEGYSHKEIAEVTGLASASVRLLLFRARRKIARLLREPERMQL
ncbi:RNA polymerase sigma factor [Acidicapsa acidisoli]|uniref:RNA polymerase sigma factor n=1 Tax=Acidicapsa acidisoli TaxID=1615681 RepID=UPI0021E007DD|nr:sigma-70 family RNA polymerase sigma factor [Acidicapsa acidisoli]